jgi:O-antigen ligase
MLQYFVFLILLALPLLGIYAYKHPGIAAGLVWSMIAMESVVQAGNSFLLNHSSLMNIVIASLAASTVAYSAIKRRISADNLPKHFYRYTALILWCVMTALWSENFGISVFHLKKNLPYIAAFAILAPMCVYNDVELKKAIQTTIFFGALVCIGIALSDIGRRGVVLDVVRGKVIEANPLAAASYGGYVAIACIFSILGTRNNLPNALLKLAIAAIALYVVVKSGSRGQLIALGIVCVCWLPVVSSLLPKRSMILAVIAVAATLIASVFFIQETGVTGRWDSDRFFTDQSGRFSMAQEVITKNLKTGPIAWLMGLGTSSSFDILDTYPHNIYAETFAEEGLIGLILLSVFMIGIFRICLQMLKTRGLSDESRCNIGILMAIFCFNAILAAKQGSLLGSSSSLFSIGLTIAWVHSSVVARFAYNLYPQNPTFSTPSTPYANPNISQAK